MTETPNNETDNTFRANLVSTKQDTEKEYDKSILTLSSTFIAASIVFLNVLLAKNYQISNYCLLIIAWWCWICSIIVVLVSFRASAHAYDASIDYEDNPSDDLLAAINRRAGIISALNIFSGLFFIAGIISFVIVASTNIQIK